jgi:hypothetical protein
MLNSLLLSRTSSSASFLLSLQLQASKEYFHCSYPLELIHLRVGFEEGLGLLFLYRILPNSELPLAQADLQ